MQPDESGVLVERELIWRSFLRLFLKHKDLEFGLPRMKNVNVLNTAFILGDDICTIFWPVPVGPAGSLKIKGV